MTGTEAVEIYAATAGHAKGARLKHTVTVADRISSRALAPIVLIFGRKSEVGGAPRHDAVHELSRREGDAQQEQAHGHLHDQGVEAPIDAAISSAPRVVLLGRQRLFRRTRLGTWHPPRRAEAEGAPVQVVSPAAFL